MGQSMVPTTMVFTNIDPTIDPTTMDPTTLNPTTLDPTTIDPTTMNPNSMVQSTIDFALNNLLAFTWIDYTVFSGMFVISALIGIYFGCFGSRQASTMEYLLGGKAMSVFPIAMSLTASNLSGITLLGLPSETYVFGTQFGMCFIAMIVVVLCMINIYLPVFYKLQLNSSYEYLKLRYGNRIRNMASAIYVVKAIMYVPAVIYIPALAFNQVSGIDLYIITPIVCLVCIFYTTLGGLKAVVWTDTLQFSVTIVSMVTVFTLGTIDLGGVSTIWDRAERGGRIEFFNMSLDPTDRCTFWGITIGLSTLWVAHFGINPACIQRYLALPSLKAAIRAVILFGVGTVISKFICIFCGLILYAKYHDCDPIMSGKVKRMDQILPFYVLDIAKAIPGLSGIFISGVFSTALSTMSTSLNTLAGTIYEDFLLPCKMLKLKDKSGSTIMKILVVTLGFLCVGLVFIVEKLGGILQLTLSLQGVTSGPLLGLMTLGMLFPGSNEIGAFVGSIVSFLLVGFMCFGQQVSLVKGTLRNVRKPLSVEGCESGTNYTSTLYQNYSMTTMAPEHPHEEAFYLFRISHFWYPVIGFLLTILIGVVVSHLFKEEKEQQVDRDLLSPVIYRFLPTDFGNGNGEYSPVQVRSEDDFRKSSVK